MRQVSGFSPRAIAVRTCTISGAFQRSSSESRYTLPVRPFTINGAGTSQQSFAVPSGRMNRLDHGMMQAVFDMTVHSRRELVYGPRAWDIGEAERCAYV
jgi:hypothetical protein